MPGFSLILDGQSVTQGSMGRDPPKYPPVQDYKKVKFPGRDISSLAAKGVKRKHENFEKKSKI